MKINFDLHNQIKPPKLILRNPSMKVIDVIADTKQLDFVLRFNAISDLTFTTYDVEDTQYYKKLLPNRVISAEMFGNYVINKVTEKNDGIKKYKEVECQSLESQLNYINITLLEGTYKLYDVLDNSKTLIGKLMEYMPNWTIEYVDSSLLDKYRTFDLSTKSVYGFMMDDVQNAYDCVILFNTIKRTITFTTREKCTKKQDIYFTYDNVIKSMTKCEENNIFTSMEVLGSDGFSINLVNPLGTNRIYNFDYYTNTDWMSNNLVPKVVNWKNKINNSQLTYANLLKQMNIKNSELITLQSELGTLQGQYDTLKETMFVRGQQGIDYSDIISKMDDKQHEIDSKNSEIASKNSQILDITNQLANISNSLLPSNNFTKDEYNEMDCINKCYTYQDEHFAITDSMDDEDKQKLAQDLYDKSLKMLSDISSPQYDVTMDLINFIALKEFEEFTKNIELGTIVTAKLNDDEPLYELTLLEIPISFNMEDITKCNATFSNTIKLNKESNKFASTLNKALSAGNDVSFNSQTWSKYEKDAPTIDKFMNSALDASLNEIKSSENEEVTFGKFGLMCRERGVDGNYLPEQLWLNKNSILMSDDGFRSSKLAIGKTYLNGVPLFGVVTDCLVGKLICGGQFEFTNVGGNFKFDSNGAVLKNSTFSILNDKSRILIDPQNGILAQKINSDGTFTDQMRMDINTGNLSVKADISGSNGTFMGDLRGCNLIGGSLDIGNGNAYIRGDGYARFNDVDINNGTFEAGDIKGTTITGGTINGTRFIGGEINIETNAYVGSELFLKENGYMSGIHFGNSASITNSTGLLKAESDMVWLNATSGIEFKAPTLKYNGSELATQSWVETHGGTAKFG